MTELNALREQLSGLQAEACRAVDAAASLGELEQVRVRYVDESELLPADPALRSFRDIDTPEDIETARDQLNR